MNPSAESSPTSHACQFAFYLHVRGEFSEAIAALDAADTSDASERDLAIYHSIYASASWALGKIDECRSHTALAMTYSDEVQDDEAYGWAWSARALLAAFDGDANAEGHAFGRATRYAMRAQDLLTQVRIFSNLGHRLTFKGHHEQALAHLERAFALLGKRPEDEITGPVDAQVRENYGRALAGLGRCDEALAQFDQARRRWLDVGAPQVRRALLAIADTNAKLGNAGRAASAYREVIRLSEEAAAIHSLVPALAGLARVTVVDHPEESDAALDRVLDLSSNVDPVTVSLAAGWIALVRGMTHVATAHGRNAEREAGRQQSIGGLADALELLALALNPDRPDGRLSEARMLWIEGEDAVRHATSDVILARRAGDLVAERVARRELRSLGVHDDTRRIAGPLMALGAQPLAGINVRILGPFSVTRDGRRIDDSEWPTPESLELLRILAGRLGGAISRGEASRRIWPAGDVTDGGVVEAIVDLQSVLDPSRTHPADHYVQFDADVLALDPENVSVDATDFAKSVRYALAERDDGAPQAAEQLERAVALYSGRFGDGGRETEWVLATREHLRQLWRRARRDLAAAKHADPAGAVRWLVGLVHEDPYDGETHLDLVRALTAADRLAEAERYYNDYSLLMGEAGLAAEPMPR